VSKQGASIVADDAELPTMVVIGDNHPDLPSALRNEKTASERFAEVVSTGRAVLLRESEFWQRMGLVKNYSNDSPIVGQLYTPAMLADCVGAPVAAVRRWHRQGVLQPCHRVRRLPYFDFTEVAIARHLAALLQAGCSLRVIDRKLTQLARTMPDVPRPLADPAVVVEGRQLFLKHGEDLAEPGGQLLIDFDDPVSEGAEAGQADLLKFAATTETGQPPESESPAVDEGLSALDQLGQQAWDWEDCGELDRVAETYRMMLVLGGSSAELHFALADVLYRLGDLSAARERYYTAIELDEEYVEARASLGCVLAENNELELAVAAFEGALTFHPDYADVHYHLAHLLDRLQRPVEATRHWQEFLKLAPESPWADMARERLDG